MEREPTTWIKLDRNIKEWRWIHNPITLAVWVQLLVKANYKDVFIGNDVVKRGEVYLSKDLLAADIGITKKQLRTALSNLLLTGEIRATKKIGKVVVISIVNYDKYQGEGQQNGNERASERATTEPNQPIEKSTAESIPADKEKEKESTKEKEKEKEYIKYSLSLSLSHKPYHTPTLDEVREYERVSELGKDPDAFYKHYEEEGWKANGKKIYSWQRLYQNWQEPEKSVAKGRPKRITDSDGITYELVNGTYEKVRG